MSKEEKTKVWAVVLIILAAAVGMFSDDLLNKEDRSYQTEQIHINQIDANKIKIIEHDGRLNSVEKTESRFYETLVRIEEKIDNLK